MTRRLGRVDYEYVAKPMYEWRRGLVEFALFFEPASDWWIGVHWTAKQTPPWRTLSVYIAVIPTVYLVIYRFTPSEPKP